MAIFSYKAIDGQGKALKGTIEGSDSESVYHSILSLGLYVISIKKTNAFLGQISKTIALEGAKRTEIIEFANNLSVMLKAGIPILTALSDIKETLKNRYFKQVVESVSRQVELGSSFSNGLNTHRDVFPDILLRLVLIGEETGKLDQSLSDVAVHLQRIETLSSSIKKAMMYPVFALIATFSALFFWMVYVLPQIIDLFNNMGIPLPVTTRILFWISDFCTDNLYFLLALPFLIVITLKILKRYDSTRYYIDMALIKLPVVKYIIYNKLLALFAEQLKILTSAGITIDKSLSIISEVIGNEVFKKAIITIREAITRGGLFSEAMAKQPVFPPLVNRLVAIGESSGSLDDQFAYLSEHYLTHLEGASQKIGTMIEPLVIGFVGALFAFIIASLLLPIYDLIAELN